MKRFFISILLLIVLFLFTSSSSYAIYNPESFQNNKFGIHILFPEELNDAANLVNSSGGDWGYITIPIRESERNIDKWQKFMDECAKYHLIPIIRIATEGDYFEKGSWEIPSNYYIIDFANFLNSLTWPTKNRYVVIFNEPNRGDEWGGAPDASSYAKILSYAVDIFKQKNDKFFIISAGLDNAAPDVFGKYVSHLNFMQQMNDAVPGIFGKIDGIAQHSYPNPGFASPPSYLGVNSINSFNYENDLINNLTGRKLPVFITETGWSSDTVSESKQALYYKEAFSTVWNDKNIVAITPFLLHGEGSNFKQFSFIVNNQKTDIYNDYKNMQKIKGIPQIEPEAKIRLVKSSILDTKKFTEKFTKDIYSKINKQTEVFFKWFLNF